jgi:hypothetical protein
VLAEPTADIEERVVRQIIEFQKPAHVGYSLEIRPANGVPALSTSERESRRSR